MDNNFILTGTVLEISDMVQIRRTTKPDIFKKMVTIKLEDNQKVFCEIRNACLKELDREGIEFGVFVEINYIFEGSEKDNKRYNNIIIKSIKRVR